MALSTANVGQGVRHGLDQMKGAAENVKETGKDVGSDVLSAVQQFGSDAKRVVQDKVGDLKDTASDYMEQGKDLLVQGKDKAMDLEHSIEDTIRQQPMTAVLVAAGLGIAIGCLINRH